MRLTPALVFLLGLGCAVARAGGDFVLADRTDGQAGEGEVVIDTRPRAECEHAALPGARCLSPADILGPARRLPNDIDLLWLLGTAGLTGNEAVLVTGQDATARDFVAGLLYLAGQRRVVVLTTPLARHLAGRADLAPGQVHGILRETIYRAPMRESLWVLKHELRAALDTAAPPMLLDGRSEAEYWGEMTRTARGGHLPGAVRLPASEVSAESPPVAPPAGTVAYAHDALDGIAYFTRLRAGRGVDVRVYPGGWAEWVADASLPADAETHPETRAAVAPTTRPDPMPAIPALSAILSTALAVAFFGGWWLARRRST